MLRHTFTLVLGLALTGTASAAGWADALFTEHQKDFGFVPRGPMLTYPFHFTNTTGQPITVSGVRVSCGCTSAVVLKGRLNASESTAVVANMDSSRFSGTKTVTIFITFSEPQFDEVRLFVTANSRDDLNLSPDGLRFGKVRVARVPRAVSRSLSTGTRHGRLSAPKGIVLSSSRVSRSCGGLPRKSPISSTPR